MKRRDINPALIEFHKLSKQHLMTLYCTKMLSTIQIASKHNISESAVRNAMNRFNIKRRNYIRASEARANHNEISLNHDQEQLIYGSLLGDACLKRATMKSNKTGRQLIIYRLLFAHSHKFFAYLQHKWSILPGSKIMTRKSGYGTIIKHYAFCNTPTLTKIAAICHKANRKHINQIWLSKLDWLGIAFWYCDDGCLFYSNGVPMIKFSTESFNRHEIKLLQNLLLVRGLETRTAKSNQHSKTKLNQLVLISRHKVQTLKFLKNIAKYIIPSMQYKIRAICDA